MGKGIFGGMFDFDNSGRLDAFEQAVELQFLNEVAMSQDNVLSDVGLDCDELRLMDPDEFRAALEDIGLDPDDFDDFD